MGPVGAQIEQVRRADEARRVAMLRGDTTALDRLIADDVTLIYGDGTTETKASLIAAIRSGSRHWTKLEYEPGDVRMYGNVAVMTGVARTLLEGGTEHVAYVTRVYARTGRAWRLIANQTTRTPASQ